MESTHNGVYTQWSLLGGVYTVESTRWSLHGGVYTVHSGVYTVEPTGLKITYS